MNLYGSRVDIDLSLMPKSTELSERLVVQILKGHKEREAFLKFLNTKPASEKTVFESMYGVAETQAVEDKIVVLDEVLTGFVVQELKVRKNGRFTAYDHLVFDSVEALDPASRRYQQALLKGKIEAKDMPGFYPRLRNTAEGLIKVKIREGLSAEEVKTYITRERLTSSMREMAREVFFGINSNLNSADLQKYLKITYQIKNLSTTLAERPRVFKEMLVKAIANSESLILLNIKCLRFTYPHGNRLKLITHTGTEPVPNKAGGMHYPLREEEYFERIEGFASIFREAEVAIRVITLVADLDLEDYFPGGKARFVPRDDLEKARSDVDVYVQNVTKSAGKNVLVYKMSDYLRTAGLRDRFEKIRAEVMDDLTRERERYVSKSIFEQRVQYRYLSNNKIFAIESRNSDMLFARERACAQLASLIALQVFAGEMTFLLAEDKGLENKLIGGREKEGLPVVFVKLRDEA